MPIVGLLAACSPAPAPAPAPAPPSTPAPVVAPPVRMVSVEDAGTPATVEASPLPTPEPDAGPKAPRAPKFALTGDCVDPVKDATRRSPHHVAPVTDPERIDLDDDDNPDWIVTTDADAYVYRGYVYLTRGPCAHYVGSWEGAIPSAGETRTHGALDLESGRPCKVDCCPTDTVHVYKFDGRAYRKAADRKVTRDCSRPFPGL